VGKAPAAMRPDLRETLYAVIANDPTMKAVIDDLRRAAARDLK
jgi:hypothetical protein